MKKLLNDRRIRLGQAVVATHIWLLLTACATQAADSLHGKVVGVADGDTVTVLDARKKRHKIRLQGIDAPELHQTFGRKSKQSLSNLVFGQPVKVVLQQRDHYGRWLGKVMVADPSCRAVHCPLTLDAGHTQLTRGLAWWYSAYAKEQGAGDAAAYKRAEQEARTRRAGLWQTKKPTPPWVWRQKHSKK